MIKLDPNNEFHTRAAERLRTEEVGWLVTVSADGTPEPSPVWFHWDGADTVLVYSQNAPKVRNIKAHPRVAFHFDSVGGGNVVTFTGSAVVDDAHPKSVDHEAYVAKYIDGMTSINYTPQSFSESYNQVIVITLEKLRGF